jgi:hypothetical protein
MHARAARMAPDASFSRYAEVVWQEGHGAELRRVFAVRMEI